MIALPLLVPAALALLLLIPATRRFATLAMPLAALPSLAAAFAPPEESLRLDSVLLGLELAVDAVNRPLLLLTGLAWTGAAWHARRTLTERTFEFWIFWLATLTALTLALLAADAAGFYLGYVGVTLSVYGLVVHARSAEALRAGRVYIVLAIAGEALILTGLLLLGARYGNVELALLGALYVSDGGGLASVCLFIGFAVKMGTVPLHVWLPLAHPVAPVPASAVLSGVIVKAGLIGWLRFLPPGAWPGDPPLVLLAALGLATAFYGVAAGLGQARLKTVLAYSTISQMGLLLAGFAATLAGAGARAAALPVIGLLILHHGLNKAALFLAAGNRPGASRLRMGLLGAAALALAGAPFTSGALAKSALAATLGDVGLGWTYSLLSLSSLATALLMLRVLALAKADSARDVPLSGAWVALAVVGLAVPWGWAVAHGLAVPFSIARLWDGGWPLLGAVVLAWAWLRGGAPRPGVPEGDVLALGSALAGLMTPRPEGKRQARRWGPLGLEERLTAALRGSERWLRTMPAAGLLLLLLAVLLWPLLGEG